MPTKKPVSGATKTKHAIATPTNAERKVKVRITSPGNQVPRMVQIKRLPDTKLVTLFKRQAQLVVPKPAKAPWKPSAKRKAIHASPNGLPIKEYKCFVYWLEGFRNEPGPLGLTADAALSSIGAFTMLLSSPMNMDSAAGLKAAGSRPLKGLSRAGENSRV